MLVPAAEIAETELVLVRLTLGADLVLVKVHLISAPATILLAGIVRTSPDREPKLPVCRVKVEF